MDSRTSTVTKLIMKLRYAAEYDDLVLTDQHKLMLDAANLLEELNDEITKIEFELESVMKFRDGF